jgi:hypothetical protein
VSEGSAGTHFPRRNCGVREWLSGCRGPLSQGSWAGPMAWSRCATSLCSICETSFCRLGEWKGLFADADEAYS